MKFTITFLLLLVNCMFIQSQNYEPIELAKKLFQTDFPDVKNYSKDEFEGHPNKSDLAKNSNLNFKTLVQDEKNAVVNVTIKDSLGKGFDSYLHFEKDQTWMITAFRGLAQMGMLQQMLQEFDKMSDKDIDKILEVEKKLKSPAFQSKEDFKFLIENTKLTLNLDDNIIKHFTDNKENFLFLKDNIEQYKKANLNVSPKEIKSHFDKELTTLYLNSFGNNYFPCADCFVLTIGGMTDNTVGYFYENDKTKIPSTDPSRVIMIREIGNGWYIFKTT